MKSKIMQIIRNNKFFLWCYCFFGSIAINLLKIFVKCDNNIILFNSFGGKKFDDSPKEIYLQLIKDDRFKNAKIYWAFHSPSDFEIPRGEKIKTDTLKYFIICLKARVWVSNSSMQRGLVFKGKKTFSFNTWHGTPIKKMGLDAGDKNNIMKCNDVILVQGSFEKNIFSKAYRLPLTKFLEYGYPRNDCLLSYDKEKVIEIKRKLNIDLNKKVILYAPTFRDYQFGKNGNCFSSPIDLNKWKEELGEEYVLLFRVHYEVVKTLNMVEDDFVKNLSQYKNLNELLMISDILISDYSSIIFDYSIMNKICYHYCYDFETYSNERGIYFDIREWFSGSDNEITLLNLIKNHNYEQEIAKTEKFKNEFINYYGNATALSVDKIYKELISDDK